MRVLFDAYWWAEGPTANRTVQREFIRSWCEEFPQDDIVLALRDASADASIPSSCAVDRVRLWPHALSNRWELPRLARKHGVDVTVAHNYAPAFGNSILFIHDLMFAEHPEWFSRAERLYFAPMRWWLGSAAQVLTSTATEGERIRGISPTSAQIGVTGLGVPRSLTESEPRRPDSVPEGQSFAVTVGRLNVRKNLELLLHGVAFSAKVTPQTPLYVVGSASRSELGTDLGSAVHERIEDGSVVLAGHLDDAELAWLYSHASLALSLSLDEGFGMPAVEAAHFGAPLLVSDIAVFRETVGSYASFTDPRGDARSVGQAIDRAWDPGRSRAEAGRALAARYSWTRAARTLRASAELTLAERGEG